jgi:hypothetical protein
LDNARANHHLFQLPPLGSTAIIPIIFIPVRQLGPHKDNIIPHDTDPIDTINNWAEKSINRLLKLGFMKFNNY